MARLDADIVIRGGTVMDGTGGAPVDADVAIAGGRIAAIGPALAARGTEEIDAKGKLVTPGFVDIHTHYDGQAVWDSHLAPSALHGVTTAVMGNCGVGFAPVRPGTEATLIELMEGVEDIPGPVLAEGLDFRWNSFADYLNVLDAKPRDIDICALVPHAAVRVFVMGERALALENANQADIAQMRDIVAEAVRAGAFGFSTSRTISHKTLKGDFTPTLRAQEEELTGIAQGLRAAGMGFIEAVSDFNQPDPETEFALLRRVAEAAGRPMVFTLTARHDRTEHWRVLLGLSNKAAAEGVSIRPVFPPRAIGILMGLLGSQNPFSGTPSYKAIAGLPLDGRVAAMRDPAVRARILSEDRFEGSNFPLIRRMLWEKMFPFGDPPDYTPAKESSIAAIAGREGRTPEAVAYDMLLADEGRSFIYCALTNYQNWDLEPSAELLRHPNAIVGLSDGGAHVGFISDASFQTFLLTYWGRDRREGRVPVQELIRRLTSDTARAAGLADRGLLKAGMKADVNVIDFDRLALHRPGMEYDLPAGGRRLMQRVTGYAATIQGGQVTYRDGVATGALPGRLVRCAA
ncbi:MAG: amidohydrolase family protein [Acetobacteraceae bacterium]|nr:amidohydrolase family protein [Acetobacteraceae bacterium]